MPVSSAQVQKARSFLYSHHKHGFGIPPARFAASAQELSVSFRELLHFISILYARGQGTGAFRMQAIRDIAAGEQS